MTLTKQPPGMKMYNVVVVDVVNVLMMAEPIK